MMRRTNIDAPKSGCKLIDMERVKAATDSFGGDFKRLCETERAFVCGFLSGLEFIATDCVGDDAVSWADLGYSQWVEQEQKLCNAKHSMVRVICSDGSEEVR